MGFMVLGENLRHVAQQAQRHGRVWRALVLEKKIEQSFPLTHTDGEKQIRMHLLEAGLHERTRNHHQRVPVDFRRDGWRQVTLEKRGRVLRLGENRLEKSVVGMCGGRERFSGCFHEAKTPSNRPETQQRFCSEKMPDKHPIFHIGSSVMSRSLV